MDSGLDGVGLRMLASDVLLLGRQPKILSPGEPESALVVLFSALEYAPHSGVFHPVSKRRCTQTRRISRLQFNSHHVS